MGTQTQTQTSEPVFSPQKLWQVMRRKDISPQQLIASVDCDPRAFADWITGSAYPRPSNLRRLAKALGVQEQDLMVRQ
jgi:Cro/C1-type HTH DNA-binding domain